MLLGERCSDVQPWQDPVVRWFLAQHCAKPCGTFPQEPRYMQIQRPVPVRDPLWLIECLEGVSGSGSS